MSPFSFYLFKHLSLISFALVVFLFLNFFKKTHRKKKKKTLKEGEKETHKDGEKETNKNVQRGRERHT